MLALPNKKIKLGNTASLHFLPNKEKDKAIPHRTSNSNDALAVLLNVICVTLVPVIGSGCNNNNYYGGVAVLVAIDGIYLRAN